MKTEPNASADKNLDAPAEKKTEQNAESNTAKSVKTAANFKAGMLAAAAGAALLGMLKGRRKK